jgi:hypothetical protein
MTINLTLTNLRQFDVVFIHFNADAGGARVVTFGTGFTHGGTLSVTASKDATWIGVFDGAALKECSRAVQA